MKKLLISTFLTLDGVMQAPGDSQEDPEGGFAYGGWQIPLADDDMDPIIGEQFAATEALLLGRVTYQIFAAYWPNAPEDNPLAQQMNTMPKYVWSTTLERVAWNNSTLVKGDLVEEVNKLKQLPGSGILLVIGSGKLAQSLMQHNLIDEYVLWIHPLVLGSGKRLFEGGVGPLHLKHVNTTTTRSGIVVLTYRPERDT